MDLSGLETLANELFVDNFKLVKGRYVSPLNIDSVVEEIGELERRKKEGERELYDSLVHVVEAIKKDGGISERTYDAHKYAINSFARDLTRQRWWGSALTHLCEREDRNGRKATPTQIARFPEDKFYSESEFNHTNIFDEGDKTSIWEGTLFQTDYNAQGNLETFRIFHQGHRNALKITRVNISELVDNIKSYMAGFSDEVPETQFDFTLDRDKYLQKVERFNAEFGDHVKVEIIGEGSKSILVARFNDNPERLANTFVELGQANEMEIQARMGSITYSVSRGDPDYSYIDLFLPCHVGPSGQREQFNPERHKDSQTLILPYLAPTFSIQLMKMYVSARENRGT